MEKKDSLLLIGTDTVASWRTGSSKLKAVTLKFNKTDIDFGTLISEKGVLTLTVTNEADKSSSKLIPLTDEAITGLSYLSQLLQVDKEVDLLTSLRLAKGFEMVRVEIEQDGQRTEIADVSHFTPQYPGLCSLFFTVKRNGKESEVKAEDLAIKPLDYDEVVLVVMDIIAEKYPWYNNLRLSTKDFIYPHLLASYAACNWSKQDNRVHIIMGETADTDDIENI